MKRKATIYLTPKGEPKRERIKSFFGIKGFNINGEATVTVEDETTWNILQQTAARGFIEIRNK